MKDKELRKVLDEKGIIELVGGKLEGSDWMRNYPNLEDICDTLNTLKRNLKEKSEMIHILSESMVNMQREMRAINDHYGITVDRVEAKYVVKEVE